MITSTETVRCLPGDLHRAVEIHPRRWQIDDETLARYVHAVRSGVKFPSRPLLWRDQDSPDSPPLIIDGWHRIKAHETVAPRRAITCDVFTGSRHSALRQAVGVNGRHGLPLTAEERTNSAWKLVRETPLEGKEHAFSKQDIVKLTGASKGTVDNMRNRWAIMRAQHASVTGDWWRDRKDEWQPPDDDAAKALMEELAQAVRQLALTYRRQLQQDQLLDGFRNGLGHLLGAAYIDRHADEATILARAEEREDERQEAQRMQRLYGEMFDLPTQT